MTIDLSDGLDFGEVLQIMKWLNVTKLLKPDLHKQLLDGTNSLLSIMSALQKHPVDSELSARRYRRANRRRCQGSATGEGIVGSMSDEDKE